MYLLFNILCTHRKLPMPKHLVSNNNIGTYATLPVGYRPVITALAMHVHQFRRMREFKSILSVGIWVRLGFELVSSKRS